MSNDLLKVQGINEKGFGMIPKLVMQDKRLTVESKAIYGYFCSYAGSGQTAFPSRDRIIADLGMSVKRYYHHLNLLKKHGYIAIEQVKESGKFKRNLYTLLQIIPCGKNNHTEKNDIPCSRFAHTQNAYTQNDHINNNSIKNKQSFKNISQSCPSEKEDRQDEDKTDDITKKIEAYTELIKDNISYSDLAISNPYDMHFVDEVISIIIDTVLTEGKTVRIGGEDKPRVLVTSTLLKLNYGDIELVIGQFKSVTERIRKKKQYILTMLYNSRLEGDSHYTNAVNADKWQ